MSEQPRCDGDLSSNIPNTLPGSQTSAHDESGKSGKKKQKRQNEIDDEEEERSRFQPLDLKSLTFKPIGSEQEVSIWLATPQEFHDFVAQFINNFTNVNITVWPLSARLTLVNVIWEFCELGGHAFPFTLRHHLAPDSAGASVPDSAVLPSTSSSQAV
jgi:hypothetical protein